MVRPRLMIRALLVALCLACGGCGAVPQPKADPRDPDIYRPVNPQYPLPR